MIEMMTTSKERRLQNIKVEYFSNNWSDLPEILNWSSGDQTKNRECLTGRWPPMEGPSKPT
jgi:hypothetical protein